MKTIIYIISLSFFPLVSMTSVHDYVTQRERGESRTLLLANIIALQAHSGGFASTSLKDHDHISTIAFSPDGSIIASGSWDKTIKLWNVQSQLCTATLIGHYSDINSIAFSPDGSTLASGSHDNTVRLWKLIP